MIYTMYMNKELGVYPYLHWSVSYPSVSFYKTLLDKSISKKKMESFTAKIKIILDNIETHGRI